MDAATLEALEFDKVVEKAAAYAGSGPGREIVGRIQPLTDPARIRKSARRVTEIRRVIEATGRFPLEGLRDLREHLKKARIPGSILPPQALLDVSSSLQAAKDLRNFLLKHGEGHANLLRIARELFVLEGLWRRIGVTLDESGEVLDEASEDLRLIRKETREVEERIRQRLRDILDAEETAEQLQESYFTIREGRHVLPVKASVKSELPGIIHDRSDTGQTVFIEPAEIVGLGNELRDLRSLERVEINRILADLTAAVGEAADELEANQRMLARADADRALARFSIEYGMCEPAVEPDGEVRLLAARHPVLLFTKVRAVPIDVVLSGENRSVVITGPNAGGKTVTLKTIGLLTLMAQAGMHVPAGERSAFRTFEKVFADIGDKQSIEESLSSFSSHVLRIREILERTDHRTLVLLDELGASTDPEEGGALSCAVLDEIHRRGAYSAVTTHLADLKVLAQATEGMVNAAAQFDPSSGSPTYQIKVGFPGSSRALETARRLGFDETLLGKAREHLSEGKARLEEIIAELEEEGTRARDLRKELEALRRETGELRQKYRDKLKAIKKEKKEVLRRAAREGEEIVRRGKKLVEETIRRLREEAGTRDAEPAERKKAFGAARRAAEKAVGDFRAERERLQETPDDALQPAAIEIGARVTVKSLRQTGEIEAVDAKRRKVRVRAGILEIEADFDDLIPAEPRKQVPPRFQDRPYTELARNVESELNLVGLRAEEARERLLDYINDALLSDREEVRVIHGHGSGVLRRVVEEALRTHRSVESFRPGGKGEGGKGATVVRLKE
jgi:DNA mismatch repair protein MutS2